MTTDEVIRKFKILAGKALDGKRVDELFDRVLNLEKISNVKTLAAILVA